MLFDSGSGRDNSNRSVGGVVEDIRQISELVSEARTELVALCGAFEETDDYQYTVEIDATYYQFESLELLVARIDNRLVFVEKLLSRW